MSPETSDHYELQFHLVEDHEEPIAAWNPPFVMGAMERMAQHTWTESGLDALPFTVTLCVDGAIWGTVMNRPTEPATFLRMVGGLFSQAERPVAWAIVAAEANLTFFESEEPPTEDLLRQEVEAMRARIKAGEHVDSILFTIHHDGQGTVLSYRSIERIKGGGVVFGEMVQETDDQHFGDMFDALQGWSWRPATQ